jgi:hypothetical protein
MTEKPKMSDFLNPSEFWHVHYTHEEKVTLQRHFSAVIDVLLGLDRKRLVGMEVDAAMFLVEALGFKVCVKVLHPIPDGKYDLESGAFSCQSRYVGFITLMVKQGESTVSRVRYGG